MVALVMEFGGFDEPFRYYWPVSLLVKCRITCLRVTLIVQAYRVRRSTSRYGLSHRDQSRRDVWMGVITPHFRDRCITPSWMNALGHSLSTPSLSSLPERPV